MVRGMHYNQTYAPVIDWPTIRLLLTMALMQGWASQQIDFVMAYPQADIRKPVYMEVPKGLRTPGVDRRKHCLLVKKNIYGGKESGRTWYNWLRAGLERQGFVKMNNHNCVFVRGTTIFMVYTDDGILLDKDPKKIEDAIGDLTKEFEIDDQGNINDYLGVKVDKIDKGKLKLSQPQLIDSILKDL